MEESVEARMHLRSDAGMEDLVLCNLAPFIGCKRTITTASGEPSDACLPDVSSADKRVLAETPAQVKPDLLGIPTLAVSLSI
jgi:hypothetical protein